MEQAVWAPYGNEQFTTFMSERMDFDKSYHPACCSTRTTRASRSSSAACTSEGPQAPLCLRPDGDRTWHRDAAASDADRRAPLPVGDQVEIVGRSPWYLAWLRLRRNRVALAFGALFIADRAVLPGGAAVGRPRRAHRAEREPHHRQDRRSTARRPTSSRPTASRSDPGLHGKFLLGADQNGRDVMVRLMYGGRTSLYIGLLPRR